MKFVLNFTSVEIFSECYVPFFVNLMEDLLKRLSYPTTDYMTEYESIYGLLMKCEANSFFTCSWFETGLRSINSQKKNEAIIQPS